MRLKQLVNVIIKSGFSRQIFVSVVGEVLYDTAVAAVSVAMSEPL